VGWCEQHGCNLSHYGLTTGEASKRCEAVSPGSAVLCEFSFGDCHNMDINTKIFLDARSDDDAVLRAVLQMTNSSAPSTLWTQVANDPLYRPFHRAVAVHELFKRYVATPITLEQIALLTHGRWLLDAVIEKVELMGGEIPVQIPPGGAGFVIRLPKDPVAAYPEFGIYLALNLAIDAELLRNALLSHADQSVGQIRIVDFAFSPRSDQW
jgi:hypothetical protein